MNHVDEFVVDLKYAKNYSDNTISSYQTDVIKMLESLNNKEIKKITNDDIKKYLRSESSLASKSLARKMSALRTFFDFLIKNLQLFYINKICP